MKFYSKKLAFISLFIAFPFFVVIIKPIILYFHGLMDPYLKLFVYFAMNLSLRFFIMLMIIFTVTVIITFMLMI